MKKDVRAIWWTLCASFLLAGCAEPPPPIVEAGGVVRLDGVPLKKVEVRFIPMIENGRNLIAKGVTDDEGRFKLTCKGQPGACACGSQVVIIEAEIPRRLRGESAQAELAEYFRSLGGRPLPQKYANLVESTLVVNVKPEQKEYIFNLIR